MKPIRYIIIGLLVTIINWGTYTLCCHYGVPILLSNILAFSFATIVSFIGNGLWTFKSKVDDKKFIKFVLGRIVTGVIIENIVLMGLVYIGLSQQEFGIPAFYSKLIAVAVSTISNYFYCNYIFTKGNLHE